MFEFSTCDPKKQNKQLVRKTSNKHTENTGLDFPPKWLYIDRIQKITLGLMKTGLPSQKFHLEALFHRWNTLVVVCTCVCTWQSWQGLKRWPWQEPGRGRSPILSMRTSLSIWYMDKMVIFLSVMKLSGIFFNVIFSPLYYWCPPHRWSMPYSSSFHAHIWG